MNVLLTGYYGFGNLGDDLLLIAGYNLLRKKLPSARISVFANNTHNIRNNPYAACDRHYIWKLLDAQVPLRDWTWQEEYDLIFHCGGGTFFDNTAGNVFDQAWNQLIYICGAPQYSSKVSMLRSFLRKKRRFNSSKRIGIGIGVGPYTASSKRLHHEAEILGEFDCLAVRDVDSYNDCLQLKLGHHIVNWFTDLIFDPSLWMPNSYAVFPNDLIGVILAGGKAGNQKIISILTNHLRLDVDKLLFLALDYCDDVALIQQYHGLGFKYAVWDPSGGTAQFLSQLSRCKFVITNRAHGAIVSATLGIPSLILCADRKLEAVHQMLPISSLVFDPSRSIDEFNSTLSAMQSGLGTYVQAVKQEAESNRIMARQMVDYVMQSVH